MVVSIPRSPHVDQLLQPANLGSRITLRRRRDTDAANRPTTTDIVGTLVELDAGAVLIRDRTGTDHSVERRDVLAARVIPDDIVALRHAVDVDPAALERIAAAGWQPHERASVGGWLLRASDGFTSRGNSVLPLAGPGLPLDDALQLVTRWYADRGLPALFAIPLPWARELDAQLARRQFDVVTPTHVMVTDLSDLLAHLQQPHPSDITVALTDRPGPNWLARYRYRGSTIPAHAVDLLLRADQPRFVTVSEGEAVIAVARGVVTPGWLGVSALDVVAAQRRRGLARLALAALAKEAVRLGARFAYLQVAHDNAAARALYLRCGFVDHHDYHYRRQLSSL